MDNVVLTPHIAAWTREALERVIDAVCRDVRSVLRGEPVKNYINVPSPRR